jgi:galactokinase
VTACAGESGKLLRMVCQPHELLPALEVPAGIRFLGIDSGVRQSAGGGTYGRTRCAAFMGHRMILEKMREIGRAGGRELQSDPMHGYLANLDPEDYKKLFRPALPVKMKGLDFLERYGPTVDKATTVHPDHEYHVRSATDHHVLEAMRVRNFAELVEEAAQHPPGTRAQGEPLDKAGHLMYASHRSYTHEALLGSQECGVLVDLVKQNEKAGLYGARITGSGSGGTVALMADKSERADAAIALVLEEYERQTGRKGELLAGTSDGAWITGTSVV